MAVGSHGTLLKIGDGAGGGEAFTTIGEVKDISGPPQTTDTEEVTSHDSGGWKEYIPTLLDAGDVTFQVNYTGAASQKSLRTDQSNKTLRNFQIVLPTQTPETLSFSAYITSFSYGAPVSGALTADITLKVTGAVTSS